MNKRIVILGAGGHGRVCAEIAKLSGYEETVFLDDAEPCGVSVAGRISDLDKYIADSDFFVAIGNNATRREIFDKVKAAGATIATLIHPSAVVSPSATVGEGTVVVAGAVINCSAQIGRCVIINTCASVDHDSVIGDYSHIAVGARVSGVASIGEEVFLGAAAAVIHCTSVCSGCVVGAGTAVIRDITERGTYVGVPAKKVK